MEVDIFKDAERRIKIFAKALWHVGNPPNLRIAIFLVGHIAAQDCDPALLDDPNAGDEPKQRGLASGIRSDHSNHLAGRDIKGNIV